MRRKINFFRLILFVCVIGYAVWVIIAQQSDINKNKQAISSLDSQIETEEIRNEELKHEESQIGTPEYMERLARERNGMIMPDEILYVDALKSN
jgi:cell division protein FtsL